MGVADNRTYKNEYLFNDKQNSVFGTTGTTEGDNPSINSDPKINTTIKENPYKSNVEIEGREVVLQPDLSALFKAVGKRHSKGGMDVLLKPNSFVFSDFGDLALSPKDHETFELKKGGKSSTDTPADVLKRNVDIKHYNSLVAILEDPHKDDLAKKSAVRMMEKYIKTLGNIAYIQEEKKGFPDGLPSFSEGTAPVYDSDLKEEIMANKQYAKAGGTIKNPYLQIGGNPTSNQDPYTNWNWLFPSRNSNHATSTIPTINLPIINTPTTSRVNTTTPVSLFTPPVGQEIDPRIKPYYDAAVADAKAGKKQSQTYLDFQKAFHTYYPDRAKEILAKYPITNYGKSNKLTVDNIVSNEDKWWGPRTAEYMATVGKPVEPVKPPRDTAQIITPQTEEWSSGQPVPNPKPNGVTDTGKKPFSTDITFTPWQKRSHLFDWFNWLNVNKYGADRAHYNATFINSALVNPEQAVGDAKAMSWQQTQAANVLNPILGNAQKADAYGKVLNAIPGIRDKYDTTNANTVNQFRQYNNQVKNNESLTNMQNDMNYAKDSTTANVNYDNMKTYLANQAMSHTMKDVTDNQSLAWKQLQLNNPRYSFNFRTGQYDINPKDVRDAPEVAGADNLENMLKSIDFQKLDDKTKLQYLNIILKNKAVGFLGQDNGMKKGGKKNPYK